MIKIINLKIILVFVLFLLLVSNIFIFSYGFVLSEKIVYTEDSIARYRLSNTTLRNKLYTANSLSNLYNKAISLGFEKKARPVFLQKPNYAYKSNIIHE